MTLENIYRYPLNSIMFMISSFIAGLTFYGIGIVQEESSLISLTLASFLYMFLQVLVNDVFLYIFNHFKGNRYSFINQDSKLDYLAMLLSLPYGVSLYFLQSAIGFASTLFIGLPFIALTIILRLYNHSESLKEDLVRAGEIGHQLTSQLKVDEVLDLFIDKLSDLMQVDYAYILDVSTNENELVLIKRVENGKRMDNTLRSIQRNEGISGKVWHSGQAAFLNKKRSWGDAVKEYIPSDVESVLSVPIQRNQRTVAVLMVASKRKNAYKPHILPIVDLLCSHLAVAIQNARNYQTAIIKSEHCALTGLYNYRRFDELLHDKFDELMNGSVRQLSLILLDIDHFKNINDTYGHQSGNDILQDIARILSNVIGNEGVVARYGGEEFVILLDNISKNQTIELAEQIRRKIEDCVFKTLNDLSEVRQEIQVRITVSMGISTAPEDTDSALTLLRNADRALYVGAKRAGRNRVAQYMK
ncbi:sensor domain-containing diguanylate cyclase [Jeotgalibacillus soli]|nr:sensor domain-containing diguanylate cyclase [Jeotgalibacillus soli]